MSISTDNWHQVKAAAEKALGEPIVGFVRQCREGPEPHSRLIAVLHEVQQRFGYLGAEQLDAVAQLMQIPPAKVSGVADFYHFFRLKPRGRFMINVCLGTCGLAPVVMVDDKVHGNVTPDQVPLILEEYLKKAREQAGR